MKQHLERVILRLVNKLIEYKGVRIYKSPTIIEVEEYSVDEYIVALDSLLIQMPGASDVYRYRGREITISPPPWRRYCKWHSGPLSEKDDPIKRLYCIIEADGYCRLHRRSERAIYDVCMSTSGYRALEACRYLDRLVKAEYALYMVDYGKPRVKVGVTRTFRLLERIAEQPHIVAVLLGIFDSAYEARKAEMMLSKKGFIVERRRKDLPKQDNSKIVASISRLHTLASIVSKELGLNPSRNLFRVTSVIEPRDAIILKRDQLYTRTLKPAGYWGGFIFLRDAFKIYAVQDKELLHMDSLLVEV